MCRGPKVNNSAMLQQQQEAAEARQREEQRQARIKDGNVKIEQQFARFDNPFYGQRRQAYMDFYQPQLDNQFKDAREAMTYELARAGLVNSSVAGDRLGDLQREYDVNRASILSRATGEENNLRSRVNQERAALVTQLNATADADRVSNEALARTQVIQQETPRYDSLGDIFGGLLGGIGQFMQGQQDNRVLGSLGTNSPRRPPSRVVT